VFTLESKILSLSPEGGEVVVQRLSKAPTLKISELLSWDRKALNKQANIWASLSYLVGNWGMENSIVWSLSVQMCFTRGLASRLMLLRGGRTFNR
jgi:hypothetical protein